MTPARWLGVFLVATVFACRAFRTADDGARPEAAEPADAAPPLNLSDAGCPDGSLCCPEGMFCDDFERADTSGDWAYAADQVSPGIALAIDGTRGAFGLKSLAIDIAAELDGGSFHFLTHTFETQPTTPFEVRFSLWLDDWPTAPVRLLSVQFWKEGKPFGVVAFFINPTSADLYVFSSGAQPSARKPAESPELHAWNRYVMRFIGNDGELQRLGGLYNPTRLPGAVNPSIIGVPTKVSIGVITADRQSVPMRAGLDGIVVPR